MKKFSIFAGFTEPLIHMFNKDDRHIRGTSYYARLKERQHIILLGDGMGDVDMARGTLVAIN